MVHARCDIDGNREAFFLEQTRPGAQPSNREILPTSFLADDFVGVYGFAVRVDGLHEYQSEGKACYCLRKGNILRYINPELMFSHTN